MVDVLDEKHPKVVSTIRMQVNDPANCATTVSEHNAAFSLMYSAHYCTPDDPRNTTAIACAWISSGVRVFDVRDPLHPREIAYYNPPANLDPDTIRAGAPYYDLLIGLRTKDSVSTQIRWVRDAQTGEQHLWFISGENGFQVVKFTNDVYAGAARPAAGSSPSPRTSRQPTASGSGVGQLPATGDGMPRATVGLTAIALALMTLSGAAIVRRR
jgi:hypothetical protein